MVADVEFLLRRMKIEEERFKQQMREAEQRKAGADGSGSR